jgi:hypothetical protein
VNSLKKYVLVCLLFVLCNGVFPQVIINTSIKDSVQDLLDEIETHKWKYHKGDNTEWAKSDYSDAAWDSAKTALDFDDLPKDYFEGIAWFRLSVNIDTLLVNKPVAFSITHNGASEIYLNGKRIKHFGKVCANDSCEKRIDPQSEPFVVVFPKCKNNVIAIRYSNAKAQTYYDKYEESLAGFEFKINSINAVISSYTSTKEITLLICLPLIGFFLAMAAVFLLIFLFYRKQTANLHYSIFAFIIALAFGLGALQQTSPFPDFTIKLGYYLKGAMPLVFLSLLAMTYSLFKFSYGIYFKICAGLGALLILFDLLHLHFFNSIRAIATPTLIIMICINCARKVWQAVKQKKDGAWIIAAPVMIFLGLTLIMVVIALLNSEVTINKFDLVGVLVICMLALVVFSIPISMSVYLARDFARTNKNLSSQLEQVQILSKQTIEQEHEKQKILNEQNTLLEKKVNERTIELVKQKELVDKAYQELHQKNKEVMDSIHYAKRIQTALITSEKSISNILKRLMNKSE